MKIFATCMAGCLSVTPLNVSEEANLKLIKQNNEVSCLAKNIYYEARGEPIKGQIAVGQVTINRSQDARFPNSICRVVHQKNQFSWTIKKQKEKSLDSTSWNKSLDLAQDLFYNNDIVDPTKGATYFHTKSVNPNWSRKFIKTATIGSHIFYRQT